MGGSINLGMHIIGEGNKSNHLPKMKNPDRIYIRDRILGCNAPEDIKEELVKRLMEYPDGALAVFYKKLPDLIETLKTKRAKNE